MAHVADGPIILASQSTARAAMLSAAGVDFTVCAAYVDEAALTADLQRQAATPARIAEALAEVKAVKISHRQPGLVIGADTVVVTADGRLLAKPETADRAAAQLRELAGTTHVLTTAAIVAENGAAVWRSVDTVRLTMRPLSEAFIVDYLTDEGAAVLGCVGTYRIEGRGAQLFTRIDGDQFTIRGLPLLPLLDYLRVRGTIAA